jgi:hypothetical protein
MLEYLSLLRNFFGLLACCLASWLSLEVCYFPAGVTAIPRTGAEIESIVAFLLPSLMGAVTKHSTMAPKGQFGIAPLLASSEWILKSRALPNSSNAAGFWWGADENHFSI